MFTLVEAQMAAERWDANCGPGAEQEWLRRYRQRFIARAGLTEEQAQACAEAERFEVLSEGFEGDPEGAADEEMSYWEE